ncbi:enoyl-CoA hydratase/isomerase family protein [Lacisediminimonas profundi]|uniref:enoyl-CoA hydratase/isomerase family protein n=1 Tax=Lacisediminimonas profundi TaxID=2603856 RepID=UPI00124B376F|nr:enoyl-CoA hydratase/isomerase family protein [Lacisediminimonas profundi]
MTNPVILRREQATLVITLNRPERRNAFDLEMRQALGEAILAARDSTDVRAVVLTGAGDHFSAGGDLKALSSQTLDPHAVRDRIRRLHPWFRELVNLEKPVIAAVEGAAFGGGFHLTLASDFVLAASNARFCAVFARMGMVPDLGGLYLLPRIVGLQRAKEIVFTAREIAADEAAALGIAFGVYPPGSTLTHAMELAARMADAPTQALGMAKNVLNRSFNLDQDTLAELESYAQAVALHSDYHRDAIERFMGKKTARFNWNNRS